MNKKKTVEHQERVPALKKLYFLAFTEGAMVIFCELLGAKVLGSFFGNSLFIWTSVIGVTVSFLALGYYVGGLLSTRKNLTGILALLFVLAGVFLALIPIWSTSLFLNFSDSSLMGGAIVASILLLGPAIFCLGTCPPIIIQLMNTTQGESGKSAGHTFAISTIAGILTTLFLGFYVLPNWGITIPLIFAASFLTLCSFLIAFSYQRMALGFITVLLGYQAISSESPENKFLREVYRTEGLMGQLKVTDQTFPGSDQAYRILFINGIPQTLIYKDSRACSFWKYPHLMSFVSSLRASRPNKSALLFGMGGGSIAKELQEMNFKLEIIDIDERMYELAQDYFYFDPKNTTNFSIDDARHFIKMEQEKHDIIVLDMISGEVQPGHVFTIEGLEELKKIIEPDGIILVQYQEKLNPDRLSGSQSIGKTFEHVGFNVYAHIDTGEVSNVILACSLQDIDFEHADSTVFTSNLKSQSWFKTAGEKSFIPYHITAKNSILLTDDKPLLESINAETVETWRKLMMKEYGLKFLQK